MPYIKLYAIQRMCQDVVPHLGLSRERTADGVRWCGCDPASTFPQSFADRNVCTYVYPGTGTSSTSRSMSDSTASRWPPCR